MPRAIDVRIEAPALLAAHRIERDDDVGRGLEVQKSEGKHRCRLESELAGARKVGGRWAFNPKVFYAAFDEAAA